MGPLRGRSLIPASLVAALAAALVAAPAAPAQAPGAPVTPIPGSADADVPTFIGGPAERDRVRQRWRPVQNPFMAPDPNSNLHNDAYMTDAYRRLGPLGRETSTASALFFRECGSVTFDSRGRIVTVCVGLDRPVLALLHPTTLEVLAALELPPRDPSGGGNPFTGFSGGGYFYLDERDRAVVPTTTEHVLVVAQTEEPDFEVVADYDVSETVGSGDAIVSALPDWRGRIWFASLEGKVGWIVPGTGEVHATDLGERIHNSFAVDETGAVFIVSDAALYRFKPRAGEVRTVWRRRYANTGEMKPGQTQAGSGTTPTLIARRNIAITDNADPIRIVVYRRTGRSGGRRLCREPLFEPGASATDQSLVAAGRSIIAENNYGYTGPTSVQDGRTTTPGLQRVDVRRGRCRTIWRSDEIAPSVVPKVSLPAGLVYTYTKPESSEGDDLWYFTALDFDDGSTVFKRLAGEGFGYNNNFAPVTIGPDGTAYVGVLGGITLFRDRG
jgi:hypothetical protein